MGRGNTREVLVSHDHGLPFIDRLFPSYFLHIRCSSRSTVYLKDTLAIRTLCIKNTLLCPEYAFLV